MLILAIDPGTTQSAWALYDSEKKKLIEAGQAKNETVALEVLKSDAEVLVIEMIKSYGNVMGDSVIETCVWIGRFLQVWINQQGLIFGRVKYALLPRKSVVTQICNNPRAKDSNVRQALIDKFGGPGVEKKGGALYEVKNDMWSALAVAVAWDEIQKQSAVQLERALQ